MTTFYTYPEPTPRKSHVSATVCREVFGPGAMRLFAHLGEQFTPTNLVCRAVCRCKLRGQNASWSPFVEPSVTPVISKSTGGWPVYREAIDLCFGAAGLGRIIGTMATCPVPCLVIPSILALLGLRSTIRPARWSGP